MDVIENIIEYGWDIVKFCLVFYFFLGLQRKSGKWRVGIVIGWLIGYSVLISCFVKNTLEIYLLFMIMTMLILFECKIWKGVLFTIWIACIVGIIDSMLMQVLDILMGDFVDDWVINCVTYLITSTFIVAVIVILKKSWSVQTIDISSGYYIFFTALGFVYTCNIASLDLIKQKGINSRVLFWIFVNVATMFIQMGMVLVLAVAKNEYRKKQELSRELLELQEEYTQYRKQQELDIRTFRHDMNTHLISLQDLNHKNDRDAVEQYLESIINKLHLSEQKIDVNSSTVDAIIRECIYRAEAQKVVVGVKGRIPESCQIELFDLCGIFSNLLNNGIEAAASAENEKKVNLTIRHTADMLMIHMENTFYGARNKKEGKYQSTKGDFRNHGIGLNSIIESIKKYDGNMDMKEEGEWFITDISIKYLGEV